MSEQNFSQGNTFSSPLILFTAKLKSNHNACEYAIIYFVSPAFAPAVYSLKLQTAVYLGSQIMFITVYTSCVSKLPDHEAQQSFLWGFLKPSASRQTPLSWAGKKKKKSMMI